MPGRPPTVGLLWRGRPGEPAPSRTENRLRAIFDEFESQGARTTALAFTEELAGEVRAAIRQLDAVLAWVDPIVGGRDRTVLDALLREAAGTGVYVSAHPDVILKMGTKEVLVATSTAEWGSDCHQFRTAGQVLEELPARLRRGARVLKQYRGSGGDGTWKVAMESDAATAESILVKVRHAVRGSREEVLPLGHFIDRCAAYFESFAGAGSIIDQPYQERIAEGMTRAYMSGDRVAGFGHQFVTALAPLPPGVEDTPVPPPRYYFGPDQPQFQRLREKLESGWIAELQALCGVAARDLPVIWDADFLLGPRDASGEDSFILCEVNVSGVFPIPDESVPVLVALTLAQLRGR